MVMVMTQSLASVPMARGFEYDPAEAALRARIRGTALEPGKAQACHSVLSYESIVNEMRRMLQDLNIEASVWYRTARRLAKIPVWELQIDTVHVHMRGLDADAHGPEWASQRQRALNVAATGQQRAAGGSK